MLTHRHQVPSAVEHAQRSLTKQCGLSFATTCNQRPQVEAVQISGRAPCQQQRIRTAEMSWVAGRQARPVGLFNQLIQEYLCSLFKSIFAYSQNMLPKKLLKEYIKLQNHQSTPTNWSLSSSSLLYQENVVQDTSWRGGVSMKNQILSQEHASGPVQSKGTYTWFLGWGRNSHISWRGTNGGHQSAHQQNYQVGWGINQLCSGRTSK